MAVLWISLVSTFMRSRSRQDTSLITLIRSFGRHSLPASRVDTMAQSMVPSTPSIQIRPNQRRLAQSWWHYGHIFIRPLSIRLLASPREGVERERVCTFGFTPIPSQGLQVGRHEKVGSGGCLLYWTCGRELGTESQLLDGH